MAKLVLVIEDTTDNGVDLSLMVKDFNPVPVINNTATQNTALYLIDELREVGYKVTVQPLEADEQCPT